MFQKAILYWSHLDIAQRMLDFDYICGNPPSVVGIFGQSKTLYKLFRWQKEIIIPSVTSWQECAVLQADMLINLASSRTATQVTKEALSNWLFRTIVVIAEWIPERETREIIALSKQHPTCQIIGPSTVWGIVAGVFRIANTWGSLENMLKSKLFTSGSVGFVSKSGGMSNEMYRVIANNSNGVHTGLTIGWDRYPYSSFVDIIRSYEANPAITMIVMLGEVGDPGESEVADLVKAGIVTKPVVAWVSGSSAEFLTQEVQFGHAWAKANTALEQASAKNTYLKECWVIVPTSFDEIGTVIRSTYESLSGHNVDMLNQEYQTTVVPKLQAIIDSFVHRSKTVFTSTISDDRWSELTYDHILISDYVKAWSIANVIGHLWLRTQLPDYALEFINTIIILLADHGPAVSGSTNAIITARAGKDIVSSLIAGLTTVGPRFGGAIQWAGEVRYHYVKNSSSAMSCVNDHKKQWTPILGIGHKIKSQYNPDVRCTILHDIGMNFPSHRHLDFALQVQEITLQKKQNLILNVDGYIAALLLDMMESIGFSDEQIVDYLGSWLFNGLFAFARSIWFIGHAIDQHRLNEGLYRTAWGDILYGE
jgi:ATP-citrate lyase alpha-subunit